MTSAMRPAARDTPSRLRRWRGRLVAVAFGALLSLAFPAANLWWLAWVALAPIVVLVVQAPSRREAAWLAWLAGTGFFVALPHWLVPSLGVFIAPVALALGLTWVPWLLVARALLGGRQAALRVAAAFVVVPAVWVVTEAVRSWKHLGGTWGLLGLTQWQVDPIVQVAALGGVWLVSALLVTANVSVAVAVMRSARPVRARAALVTVAVVIAATVYGLARPEPAVAGAVRVAGIQPGVVHDPWARLAANERITRNLAESDERYDLVVWGQSSVGFDPDRNEVVERRLRAAAAAAGTDVFVNVDARGETGKITKSMRQYTPEGAVAVYEKSRLVPFGEYIPLRPLLGWLAEVTKAAEEDRAPGGELTTMRSGGVVIGPLISYESTFPDLRRAVVRLPVAPHFTLVQAASTTFQASWAQPQQASFEAVRAVETGRPAVLVAVSGTSAAFDARGGRLAWVPSDVRGWFIVDVPLSREDTPYVRWGDWVVWASWAAVLVAAAAAVARRECQRRA